MKNTDWNGWNENERRPDGAGIATKRSGCRRTTPQGSIGCVPFTTVTASDDGYCYVVPAPLFFRMDTNDRPRSSSTDRPVIETASASVMAPEFTPRRKKFSRP